MFLYRAYDWVECPALLLAEFEGIKGAKIPLAIAMA